MRERKTKDVYQIMSNYGYGWDCECECETLAEAKQTLKEYIENCPTYGGKRCQYRMERHRVRKEETA